MKKISIITLFISVLMISCTQMETIEAIDKKIAEHKSEIHDIELKLADLEAKKLLLDTTAGKNKNGIRVVVKAAQKQEFSHYFKASGELESINEAFVSPETNGQIVSIYSKEGQTVKRGEVMAKLNTNLIEKNIEEVETQLKLAKTVYEKQKDLWSKSIGSELQYLEAETNYTSLKNKLNSLQAQYDMSIIKAPIDGIVEEVYFKEGEMASPGMQLFQVVNLNSLYVNAKLSESYLSSVSKGDMVSLDFPAYPEIKMDKPVYRVGNVINPQNRTFILQVKIDNPEAKLKPNMLANIIINDYNSQGTIVVPSIVIREDLTGSYVYVAVENQGDWIARKKYIQVGISHQDKTEVLSGLEEGDLVIVTGYNNVSDGLALIIS